MSDTVGSPFKNYGFTYEHNGSNFMFTIAARSENEARSHLSSMAMARCDGVLRAVEEETAVSVNTRTASSRLLAICTDHPSAP